MRIDPVRPNLGKLNVMKSNAMRMMSIQRKIAWLTLIALLLTLLVGVGAVQAQKSANYNLALNSLAGGNRGGTMMSSASYTLVVSSGTSIKVSTTSPGYELCTGFVCQSNSTFFQMRLPTLSKSPTD